MALWRHRIDRTRHRVVGLKLPEPRHRPLPRRPSLLDGVADVQVRPANAEVTSTLGRGARVRHQDSATTPTIAAIHGFGAAATALRLVRRQADAIE